MDHMSVDRGYHIQYLIVNSQFQICYSYFPSSSSWILKSVKERKTAATCFVCLKIFPQFSFSLCIFLALCHCFAQPQDERAVTKPYGECG